MPIEVALFIVIGAVAVASAVMMLLTENAVHSALFLILNFACVAFLFLMLDASFLAMVQLAVYAGAIMVLFLFVIMLLGAEKVGGADTQQFSWQAPGTLILTMAFLIAVGMAIIAGRIDDREIEAGAPLLRVVHVAPGAREPVDIYVDDVLVGEGQVFRDVTDFAEVEPGEHTISLALAGDGLENAFALGTLQAEAGSAFTAIAYGDLESPLPALGVVAEDLTVADQTGRLTVFNAYAEAPTVDLIDAGSDFIIRPDEEIEVILEGVAYGTASETLIYEAGGFQGVFIPESDTDIFMARINKDIEADTSELVILAGEPDNFDNTLRPLAYSLVTDTNPALGSPKSIGQSLFVKYVLPFQIVALLLLATMVGAIVLSQRGEIKPKPGRLTRRKVSRPLTSVIATQTGHDVTVDVYPQLEPPDSSEQPDETL